MFVFWQSHRLYSKRERAGRDAIKSKKDIEKIRLSTGQRRSADTETISKKHWGLGGYIKRSVPHRRLYRRIVTKPAIPNVLYCQLLYSIARFFEPFGVSWSV